MVLRLLHPPRWAEYIVCVSCRPEDRDEYLLDFRHKYRAKLRLFGKKAAMKFAIKEVLFWLPVIAYRVIRLYIVMRTITKL